MMVDVAAAMSRIEPGGVFAEEDVEALRAAVTEAAAAPLDHPSDLFGPWADLPDAARKELRRTVERDISAEMALWPHGAAWTGAVQAVRTLDRFLDQTGGEAAARWRGTVVRLGETLRGGPAAARRRARRALESLRWSRGRGIRPATLLSALGKSPHWLIGDFVRGVRVDPRAHGHFHDPRRNLVYGYHLSLDLIPVAGGMVLSEVNLEPGAIQPRHEPFFRPGFADGIVDAAIQQRARRIVWMEARRYAAPDWILEDLHARTRSAGLALEVYEDPCMPPRRSHAPGGLPGRWPYPLSPPDQTLVVRRNSFGVAVDWALDDKEPLIRGLSGILAERGERRVRVAPMTVAPGLLELPEHPGLPNLVYKYPDAMAGKGVFFMRTADPTLATRLARDLDRRHGRGPGLFQPFVASDLVYGCVQDVRAWVFLSPLELRYLGGLRSRMGQAVPESLPEGLAPAGVSFTPKRIFGAIEDSLPPELEARTRQAAAIVGDGLRAMLARTFVTTA